ncbi:MAG: helix-turn-helix domain-containing protein [bacterium]|nr:helix-turn-helix domain-containing protein [bacterium]
MKTDLKIGEKIKALRQASDLTQEELANRAQLTKGFISQLENDHFQTSISLDSLADILEVFGVSLSAFFDQQDEPQVVFKPSERISLEGTGATGFELLVPGSTNNQMDPIYLSLKPGEQLEARDPHPGEQFGYVTTGTVTLKVGQKTYTASKKHCFYFTSDKPNQIMNNSAKDAALLWVVTPPQM